MPKKTIKVDQLILKANFQLARTDKIASKDFKKAICQTIESVLRATGNYNGYRYLNLGDSRTQTVGYWSRCYSMPHWSVY